MKLFVLSWWFDSWLITSWSLLVLVSHVVKVRVGSTTQELRHPDVEWSLRSLLEQQPTQLHLSKIDKN